MKGYLLSVFIGLSGSVKSIRLRTSFKSAVKGLRYVALAKYGVLRALPALLLTLNSTLLSLFIGYLRPDSVVFGRQSQCLADVFGAGA